MTGTPFPAPFASKPEESRGRLHPESESPTRTAFQRDRDRVIHSGAFRRLKYKTQVFVFHEGDYYRTRLTHSLEVAQIARSICRALGVNEDLAEAVALAHDFGHTPFGHSGEEALNDVMAAHGGFDHNEQTLRILTRLESRYADFDGLNLTWETLEGVVKHNGPWPSGPDGADIPASIAEYVRSHDLELDTHPGLEAQVAALADDVAYVNHDIDDGLRAGLFQVADMAPLPLAGPVFAEVEDRYPGLEQTRLIHESVRRLINHMVNDMLAETGRRLEDLGPRSVADIRAAGQPTAAFSRAMAQQVRDLKGFLFEAMYRHHKVNRMASKAKRVVQQLFNHYLAEPQCLPPEWRRQADDLPAPALARLVADYIAGMTDRYALDEHRRLFDPYART